MIPSDFVPFLKSGGKAVAGLSPGLPASSSNPSRDNAVAAAGFSALIPSQSAPATAPTSNPISHSHANAKPVVTLKRNGDQVTHIHIQCACGEVVELECAY
jgi:hypothetical protein